MERMEFQKSQGSEQKEGFDTPLFTLSTESYEKQTAQRSTASEGPRAQLNPRHGQFTDVAYDADIDEKLSLSRKESVDDDEAKTSISKIERLNREREHIFELFQPWALKTYGDQAKTKTITLRKKARILKALEGKEHSKPDSSKFRFWVKSKAFTTKRPEGFEEVPSNQKQHKPLSTSNILSENPREVDLFVGSTIKEFGKRTFRKVAAVEEFFDIIYNVHMELGGRSGMHAGQKRTYRIITETYAFLPREAVTRFLSICPECKKNLRAISPAASSHTEEPINESSSDVEAINCSSYTESALESGPAGKKLSQKQRRYSIQDAFISKAQSLKQNITEQTQHSTTEKLLSRPHSNPTQTDISSATKAQFQLYDQTTFSQPYLPPLDPTSSKSSASAMFNTSQFLEVDAVQKQHSLMQYYAFMRQYCSGELFSKLTKEQLQHLQTPLCPTSYTSKVTPPPCRCVSNTERESSSSQQVPFSGLSKIPSAVSETIKNKYYGAKSKGHNPEENISGDAENEIMMESCTEPTAKKFKSSSQEHDNIIEMPQQTSTPKPNLFSRINTYKSCLFRSKGTSQPLPPQIEHDRSIQSEKSENEPRPISGQKLLLAPSTSTSVPSIVVPSLESLEVSPFPNTKQPRISIRQLPSVKTTTSSLGALDLEKLKPITSTYLQLTRSMGLSDEDALRFDNLETLPAAPTAPDTAAGNIGDTNTDSDPYAGLIKDADKLKLMLLAWNYQNSNAVRNGTEGPDLSVVGGLWAQYQNALAQNAVAAASSGVKLDTSLSPVPRNDANSPIEAQDETNSSGQKEEDEGSEDDSDDKLDEKLATHDPERLKAFNMFVRLFVDENLDRIVPISKQPKEKIQAIIDSCARQFPEFSDRSRKRIRTYLKSCRRNKKTRDGWENTTRPTPAHLTSVQAEQILAIACENESMNAKRMRIGLEPITHAIPAPGSAVAAAAAAAVLAATNSTVGTSAIGTGSCSSSSTATSATVGGGNDGTIVTSAALPFGTVNTGNFARSTPNSDATEPLSLTPAAAVAAAVAASSNASGGVNSARSSPLALSSNASGSTSGLDVKPLNTILSNGSGSGANVATATNGATGISGTGTSPLYRPSDFTSPSTASSFASATAASGRTVATFPGYFPGIAGLANATPTDLSMKAATSICGSNSISSTATTVSASAVNNCNLLGSNNSLLAGLNANINATNNSALVTASQLQQLQQQQLQQQQQQQQLQQQNNTTGLGLTGSGAPTSLSGASNHDSSIRPPPLLGHKLSQNEVTAARQVISAYRESAAFLLRTADQVEQLLVQQQQQ